MNPEIKQRWVAALRSGEYEQGKGFLNSDGKFCCLGVLCDLHSQDHNIPWTANDNNSVMTYFDNTGLPPEQVVDWAQYDHRQNGWQISHAGVKTFLYMLNDETSLSFSSIADIIEKQL